MNTDRLERREFLRLAAVGAGISISKPALLAPTKALFRQKEVFISGQDGIHEYRIPALVTTTRGTLLAACDARVERSGDAPNNIDLVLKRSVDNGETWSGMAVVLDFPGYQAVADPCMLVDQQSGNIWVIYSRVWPSLDALEKDGRTLPEGLSPGWKGRVIMLQAIVSRDEGQTWSQPREIYSSLTQPGWTAVMGAPGTGIQTRSGRLLVPCYSRRAQQPNQTIDYSSVAYSDDQGKTWTLGAAAGPKTNECQVVELADGQLMLNMRSLHGKGCRAVATSRDGGETWSKLRHDTRLIEPQCQASFIRYLTRASSSTGNQLLFSNPAHREKRVNMTVRLSNDSGETWPISRVIHPGPSAYSCMTQLQDGSIGLLYENGNDTPYERISFARFNLEWLSG